jgi:epoxyqueuosine reductase QueG
MEERAHHRESPAALWPEVRSVIALGMSYAPAVDPMALAREGETGRISVYAQGADYHDLIKRKLKELARSSIQIIEPCAPSASHWRSRSPAAGAASARAIPQSAKPISAALSLIRCSSGLSWRTRTRYHEAQGRTPI